MVGQEGRHVGLGGEFLCGIVATDRLVPPPVAPTGGGTKRSVATVSQSELSVQTNMPSSCSISLITPTPQTLGQTNNNFFDSF